MVDDCFFISWLQEITIRFYPPHWLDSWLLADLWVSFYKPAIRRLIYDRISNLDNLDYSIDFHDYQWIGLRENLQETIVFTIKYRGFL